MLLSWKMAQMKYGTTSTRYVERLRSFVRVYTVGLTDHHAARLSARGRGRRRKRGQRGFASASRERELVPKNKRAERGTFRVSQRVWSLIESTQCVQESFWVDKNDLHGQHAQVPRSRETVRPIRDASVRIRLRCRQQPSEKLMFEILVTRVSRSAHRQKKSVAKALESGRD